MKGLNTRLRSLQRRLGPREELIAAIVVGVLAASGLAFTLITNQGTPAGSALAYMGAVDRADTNYVWSHSIVDSAKVSTTDTSLMDRAALAAQLAATAHTRSGYSVQDVSYVSGGTKVTLSYITSDGRKTIGLVMRGAGPHSWPVLLEPAGLDLNLPPGPGALAIDGQIVAATAGKELKVAVFPGTHKLTVAASRLYLSFAETVDAESSLPDLTSVSFAKVQVTDEAASLAKQAVSRAIQSCTAATDLRPAACLQSYATDVASAAATWTLLGDPTAGASVGLDAKSLLEVTGHYLMKLNYGSQLAHEPRQIAVGGPYLAQLQWDGQTLSVAGFGDASSVPTLEQPPATNTQVVSVLETQFNLCLKLQAGSSAECPQQVTALFASNFVWHANGDPTHGSAFQWDSTQGIFKVIGDIDFSVTYDSTPPFSPTRNYQDRSTDHYTADLYWDGAKVVFVGFEA
jgi:hypothetical protein